MGWMIRMLVKGCCRLWYLVGATGLLPLVPDWKRLLHSKVSSSRGMVPVGGLAAP